MVMLPRYTDVLIQCKKVRSFAAHQEGLRNGLRNFRSRVLTALELLVPDHETLTSSYWISPKNTFGSPLLIIRSISPSFSLNRVFLVQDAAGRQVLRMQVRQNATGLQKEGRGMRGFETAAIALGQSGGGGRNGISAPPREFPPFLRLPGRGVPHSDRPLD